MVLISASDPTPPLVSIIIPLHRDGECFRRCLAHYWNLSPETPFEVVVVTDGDVQPLPERVVHVRTGSPTDTSPAVKRDIGAKAARGSVFAYIDDDAYPSATWLHDALEAMKETGAAAIGGPGITPPDSGWRERLGGAVYESRVGTGPLRHRFLALQPHRVVDDVPAYNFVVQREAVEAVGGWNSTFYGGEDTKICLSLIKEGYRLVYSPNALVYHYRRPVLRAHLRQVANVGRHRGFFVRRYPATSRRAVYFLPSLGVIGIVPVLAATLFVAARSPGRLLALMFVAWSGLTLPALGRAGLSAPLFPPVLLLHHAAYGFNFVRGLLGKDLTN